MTDPEELTELRAMIEEVSRFARETAALNAENGSKLVADVSATYAEAIAHVTRHLTHQRATIIALLRAVADAGIDVQPYLADVEANPEKYAFRLDGPEFPRWG